MCAAYCRTSLLTWRYSLRSLRPVYTTSTTLALTISSSSLPVQLWFHDNSYCCSVDTAGIAYGAESMKRSSVRPSACPSACLSVCPVTRPQPRHAAGLLLSAARAGDIDRQRRSPRAPRHSGAAARRSAANASRVTLTADSRS